MLAASGTPLIDAHLDLQLVRYDESSGRENEIPTTLFIQYKHTGELTLCSANQGERDECRCRLAFSYPRRN
jgi:hypothetical protein